jgi:hypothetical protein
MSDPVLSGRDGGVHSSNKFYTSWVRRIHIDALLDTRDLACRHDPVKSLLDSTVLDEIAREAVAFSRIF